MHANLQATIRAVCSIIDAFHFQPEAATAVPAGEAIGNGHASEAEGDPASVEADAERKEDEPSNTADSGREITSTLARRVLPVLQSALVKPSILYPYFMLRY